MTLKGLCVARLRNRLFVPIICYINIIILFVPTPASAAGGADHHHHLSLLSLLLSRLELSDTRIYEP